MKFKIHFTVGKEDYFIVEGDGIPEIKEKASSELKRRGLDVDKHNVWSEEIF